jgi:hypothetical protein
MLFFKKKENKILKYILQNMLISGFIFLSLWFLFSFWLKEILNFNIDSIANTDYFRYFLNLLLAIWLYTGVYWIDKKEFRENKRIIFKVVTLWVILKSAFIWWIFYLLTWNILGFLLWIAIAQIDPLSVSHLIWKNKRLSNKAETIFRSWSSFDDPMTVLLLVYIALPIIWPIVNSWWDFNLNYFHYFMEVWANFVFVWVMYYYFKKFKKNKSMIPCLFLISLNFLLISFFFSIYLWLLLSVALIALFIRPDFWKNIEYVIAWAFYISIFILWMFLVNWVNIESWILLGGLVFISQFLVTFLFWKEFSFQDKMYLWFGQQNWITSIILALFLEKYFPWQIVSTIWIAILTITILYFSSNYILDKKFSK